MKNDKKNSQKYVFIIRNIQSDFKWLTSEINRKNYILLKRVQIKKIVFRFNMSLINNHSINLKISNLKNQPVSLILKYHKNTNSTLFLPLSKFKNMTFQSLLYTINDFKIINLSQN